MFRISCKSRLPFVLFGIVLEWIRKSLRCFENFLCIPLHTLAFMKLRAGELYKTPPPASFCHGGLASCNGFLSCCNGLFRDDGNPLLDVMSI